MYRKILFLVLVLGALNFQNTFAQCAGKAAETLDANKVRAQLNNSADQFWDLEANPGYEVPLGSGKHSGFAMATWIGGYDENQSLRLAAHTYRQGGLDFGPGPYRSSQQYECGKNLSLPGRAIDAVHIAHSTGAAYYIFNNGVTRWDPQTGASQTAPFLANYNRFNAIELPSGEIFVIGDLLSAFNSGPSMAPLLVDPVTLVANTLFLPNYWHGASSLTLLANGKVLISGAQGSEVFDPATLTFTATGNMIASRDYHEAVLLPNGDVMALPGSSNPFNPYAGQVSTYELYNPTAGTWSAGPSTPIARGDGTRMQLLSSGEFLILGGESDVLELYDPATGLISQIGTLGFPMYEAYVNDLGNGKLAVAGSKSNVLVPQGSLNTFFYDLNSNTVTRGEVQGFNGYGMNLLNGNFAIANDDFSITEIDGTTLKLVGQPWEQMWKLNRSEVDQFIQDYNANNVNFANYPDLETWPGNGDVASGEDQYLAPFVDVDQDGVYDPSGDGDYPCIPGDQAVWWVYNDAIHPHTESGGATMGVQMEAMAYAYDCSVTPCPDTSLDYVTFYHYKIKNKGGFNYVDTYFGLFMDVDIGNYADDYVGCDTNRNMGFGYNGNATDQGATGYGANPPALGTVFLETPADLGMTNFNYFENDFSINGNPELPSHYYGYMRSLWKDGSHMTYGGNGYGGTVNTDYMYPGDPGWCGTQPSGWSEPTANGTGNVPFDRRYVQSVGPFEFLAGQEVEIDLAVVWGRDSSGNLGSVCRLLSNADAAQSWFDQQSHGCFDIVTSTAEEALVKDQLGVTLYPNPNAGQFTVEWEEASRKGGTLEILDLWGRTVMSKAVAPGSRKVEVSDAELAQGMYLLRMDIDGKTGTQRMMVD